MPDWKTYIESNDKVVAGKPIVKGTRLSVEFLIQRLADGWSEHDILESYPHLTQEALRAVYAYVLEIMQDGLIYSPISKDAA